MVSKRNFTLLVAKRNNTIFRVVSIIYVTDCSYNRYNILLKNNIGLCPSLSRPFSRYLLSILDLYSLRYFDSWAMVKAFLGIEIRTSSHMPNIHPSSQGFLRKKRPGVEDGLIDCVNIVNKVIYGNHKVLSNITPRPLKFCTSKFVSIDPYLLVPTP